MTDLETRDSLALMRERFRLAEEAEQRNRERALAALRFFWGEQWAADIEQQRSQDGRPCFTLNKVPAILRQVINEAEANPPAIQVNPVSDGADEERAQAEQGLFRHAENNGEGADVAYGWALVYMTICGFGSWRITTDYLPKSFDQDVFLERIVNPFSVYWDPAAKKLDKSDARFCFVTHDFTADAFKDAFPGSELLGVSDFATVGDQAPGWLTKDGCRVVEYFTVESENVDLVKLTDGRTVYADEIPKGAKVAKGRDGKQITRPDVRRRAYVAKSNGVEWLEEKTALPTDDIPVVTVLGEALDINGEMHVKGMVQDLIEPQRLFNYNSSAIAETMALGARAQWVATAEQVEPYLALWKQANSRNIAVLPYKSVANANPPQRISSEPPIQAMSAAREQSSDDLRSISGVYDATQAPNGGEESGRAILARRRQTSSGNRHYLKQLGRGIQRTARILLKYFPVIYDTPRVVRILGADKQPMQIMVHAGNADQVPATLAEGIKGVFDLSIGNFDVTFSIDDHETKRQEAVETLMTLCQAEPAIVPVIGDLVVDQMDFSGKQAIVERMRKALPPNLQDGNATDPNQLAAHNSQLMQQNQTLMQQVQRLTQLVQTKQIEAQGRLQVEGVKLQATETRANASVEAERIKAQAALISHAADKQFDAVHDHALAVRDHVHGMVSAEHAAAIQRANAEHAAALNPPLPQAA